MPESTNELTEKTEPAQQVAYSENEAFGSAGAVEKSVQSRSDYKKRI
jgi:hypothetical protein